MRNRVLSILVLILLIANTAITEAQQTKKNYRIGYLANASGIGPVQEQFRNRLRELGYAEKQNLTIEWKFTKGDVSRYTEFAAELVNLNLDCIVAVGVGPTRAVKQASATIPIVMANADDDPVRHGLVASLARPGGNVTGFVNIGSDLAGKRIELLKEIVPKLSRIAIVRSAGEAAVGHEREAKTAASALGLRLQSLEVKDGNSLAKAFQNAKAERAEAITIVHTGLITSLREQTVKLSTQTRLPSIFSDLQPVLEGGLMSYSDDSLDRYRRVAEYVDRILRGTKPADLPVQRPMKFEFVVNLNTANQIGVSIPQWTLMKADRVIR